MIRDNKIVLDINDDPILDYHEMPAAVSSKLEAPFMEAISRLNNNIQIKDIRARMPRNPHGQWDGSSQDPIRIGNLSMAMTRFRAKSGLLSWGKRDGSQAIEEYLESLLPQACKDANSTRDFRDLFPHEMAEMRLQNIGRFPERSRMHDDCSEARKETVQRAALAKIERLKQKFDADGSNQTSDNNAQSNAKRKRDLKEESDKDAKEGSILNSPPRRSVRKRIRTTQQEALQDLDRMEASHIRQAAKESLADLRRQYESSRVGQQTTLRYHNVNPEDYSEDDSDGLVTVDRSCSSISYAFMSGALQIEEKEEQMGTKLAEDRASHIEDNEATTCGIGEMEEDRADAELHGSTNGDEDQTGVEDETSEEEEDSDNENFLYLNPSTSEHRLLLQHLLGVTRREYYRLAQRFPPDTDPFSSYISQFGDLQTSYDSLWRESGHEGLAPLLTGVVAISATDLQWNREGVPSIPTVSRLIGVVLGTEH